MTNFILSCLCFAISGFCFALIDKITHHFSLSIFRKLNPTFWNPVISWRNKYINTISFTRKRFKRFIIPVVFSDAWHLFKTLGLTFLMFGTVFYRPFLGWFIDLVILGMCFGGVFTVCYNYLFVIKK